MNYSAKTDEYTQEEVIQALKFTREKLDIDRIEMAAELNVPYNTYCRWERGVMHILHKTILVKALQSLLKEKPNGTEEARLGDKGDIGESQEENR